jgi:aconitase A
VKAVVAESFERIHRSNLVGMGVLPLQFQPGSDRTTLNLDGSETFDITGLSGGIQPGMTLTLVSTAPMAAPRKCPSSAASTPSMRWNTSATAASSITCCGSCWPPRV